MSESGWAWDHPEDIPLTQVPWGGFEQQSWPSLIPRDITLYLYGGFTSSLEQSDFRAVVLLACQLSTPKAHSQKEKKEGVEDTSPVMKSKVMKRHLHHMQRSAEFQQEAIKILSTHEEGKCHLGRRTCGICMWGHLWKCNCTICKRKTNCVEYKMVWLWDDPVQCCPRADYDAHLLDFFLNWIQNGILPSHFTAEVSIKEMQKACTTTRPFPEISIPVQRPLVFRVKSIA